MQCVTKLHAGLLPLAVDTFDAGMTVKYCDVQDAGMFSVRNSREHNCRKQIGPGQYGNLVLQKCCGLERPNWVNE